MKKLFLAFAVAVALAGCTPSAEIVSMPVMPQGFEGCTIGSAYNGVTRIYLARCPNSTTTADYSQGKTHMRTVTVDGITYTKDEK
jgi:hypothetical protein